MSAHAHKDQLKAIPTEYRGVRYRSKSEAMFAAWLDLEHKRIGDPHGIVYEPDYFRTEDGWVPDFLVWNVIHLDNKPEIRNTLYEYKPSKPTNAYLELFVKRTKQIHERFASDHYLSTVLVYGSVYEQNRGFMFGYFGSSQKPELRSFDWLTEHEQAIRLIRFDLECKPCHE